MKRAVSAKARHNLIPFGDHVFHDVIAIEVSGKEVIVESFQAFRVGRKARRGVWLT